MPPMKILLRPTRSPTRPRKRVKPAADRANEVAIHWRSERAKPSPSPIAGSATFRIEKSTASMNWATSRTARTSFDRPVSRCGSAPARAVTPAVAVAVVDMAFPSKDVNGSKVPLRLGR